MPQPITVANSSPFIALERIGRLDLLPALFGKLLVPPAVRSEVFAARPLPVWVEERPLVQTLAPRIAAVRLGPGEREAIAIALEVQAAELLLDDLAARRLAISLRIPLLGALGLLLRARKRGLVREIRPLLDALNAQDFHISARLYRAFLTAAGEPVEPA
jgi:hypothetical protein